MRNAGSAIGNFFSNLALYAGAGFREDLHAGMDFHSGRSAPLRRTLTRTLQGWASPHQLIRGRNHKQ